MQLTMTELEHRSLISLFIQIAIMLTVHITALVHIYQKKKKTTHMNCYGYVIITILPSRQMLDWFEIFLSIATVILIFHGIFGMFFSCHICFDIFLLLNDVFCE